MKGYLAEKGIFFPNTTALIEACAQLHPVIQVEFDGDGVSVDYTALVKSTSFSLIGMIQNKDPEAQPIDPSKSVVVVYKDGGDTAGSQTGVEEHFNEGCFRSSFSIQCSSSSC